MGHFHFLILGSLSLNGINIALDKPARQPHTEWSGVASRAVDGNSSTRWEDLSCTHTVKNHASGAHWWQVDLLGVYNIGMVQITNRDYNSNCKLGSHEKMP